jgi:crossover junction endodeoxyribonuclease RuvC
MPRRYHRILAIDPGTREMGVAVLEGRSLLYHGVEVFKRPASRREILCEGRRKFSRLLKDYHPAVVVVERTLLSRRGKTATLHAFADELVAIIRRKRLPMIQIAPSTIKKAVCGNGHADKREVARAVTAHFPELTAYLRQDRKWKEKFQANRFDAVAVGLCFRDATPFGTLRRLRRG